MSVVMIYRYPVAVTRTSVGLRVAAWPVAPGRGDRIAEFRGDITDVASRGFLAMGSSLGIGSDKIDRSFRFDFASGYCTLAHSVETISAASLATSSDHAAKPTGVDAKNG